MNPYSLPAVIAFTLNFSIALMVLLEKPREPLNQWFSSFVFIFSVWNLSEILILNSAQYEKALFGAQILYRVLFLAPAIFLIISFLFPKHIKHYSPGYGGRIMIIALPVLLLALSFPNFKITILPLNQLKTVYYYKISTTPDLVFILLLFTATTYLTWGTVNLIKKLGKVRTYKERSQILFLLIGVVSIFIAFIVINLVSPLLGRSFSFYFLSTALTLFISFFFFASITQYKMLKLSRLLTGSIAYALLSSIVLAVYFLIVKALSEGLGSIIKVNSFFVNALIIFVLILLIRPFESKIQRFVDRLLYKNIYSYRRKFLAFSNELLDYYDTGKFMKKIHNFLIRNFKIQEVLIFLKTQGTGKYSLWGQEKDEITIPANGKLTHRLLKDRVALEYHEIQHELEAQEKPEIFNKADIRIFLPIIHGRDLTGFMALSGKKNNRIYTQEELEILSIFSNEMAIALYRNQIIETMQQRERERARMERLAAVGQMTAGIAHEIRNPLNTIATSAETLLRKKLASNTEQDLKNYILEETNRLSQILTDFLKLSRIESLQPESIVLDDFLKKVMLDIEMRLSEDVEFHLENLVKVAEITIPVNPLYEVLLNLALNAIHAVDFKLQEQPGYKGLVKLKVFSTTKNYSFQIEDNGNGIPEEIQEKIFDPFFTTKSDGTGLGLSIAAKIAEALNGKLSFTSGAHGSCFTFSLPKK